MRSTPHKYDGASYKLRWVNTLTLRDFWSFPSIYPITRRIMTMNLFKVLRIATTLLAVATSGAIADNTFMFTSSSSTYDGTKNYPIAFTALSRSGEPSVLFNIENSAVDSSHVIKYAGRDSQMRIHAHLSALKTALPPTSVRVYMQIEGRTAAENDDLRKYQYCEFVPKGVWHEEVDTMFITSLRTGDIIRLYAISDTNVGLTFVGRMFGVQIGTHVDAWYQHQTGISTLSDTPSVVARPLRYAFLPETLGAGSSHRRTSTHAVLSKIIGTESTNASTDVSPIATNGSIDRIAHPMGETNCLSFLCSSDSDCIGECSGGYDGECIDCNGDAYGERHCFCGGGEPTPPPPACSFSSCSHATVSLGEYCYSCISCSGVITCDVRDCPGGTYCDSDGFHYCPSGSYCPIGSVSPIPCDSTQFCPSSSGSPIPCYEGYTCTSTSSTPCPAGYYCSNPNAGASPVACTDDEYCPFRTHAPVACPSGNICTSSSAIPCPERYYCPGGSNENAVRCVGDVYCPSGSGLPRPCPPGDTCYDGVITSCAPGQACDIPMFVYMRTHVQNNGSTEPYGTLGARITTNGSDYTRVGARARLHTDSRSPYYSAVSASGAYYGDLYYLDRDSAATSANLYYDATTNYVAMRNVYLRQEHHYIHNTVLTTGLTSPSADKTLKWDTTQDVGSATVLGSNFTNTGTRDVSVSVFVSVRPLKSGQNARVMFCARVVGAVNDCSPQSGSVWARAVWENTGTNSQQLTLPVGDSIEILYKQWQSGTLDSGWVRMHTDVTVLINTV